MREKDHNAIHSLFCEFHYVDDLGVIKTKLTEYVTTARREAREEAFREASNLVHAMSRVEARGKSFDFLSGAGWMQNKAALLLAQRGVEAATKNGDTDG